MVNRKIILLLLVAFLIFFLTGCWDDVELEERGFISGIAVDLADEQGENTTFEMTEQFVVPAGLGTPTAPSGGKAYRNLSQTGESLFEINRDLISQMNRVTNIEHLDLVIISTDVAKEKGLFANILDVFVRQQNMRRGMFLTVVDGKAKELLNVEAEQVRIPAQYISELMENNSSLITTEPIRLGDIQEALLNKRSYIIPQLKVLSDNIVEYEGIAVFHGHTSRLVGTLMDEEVKGFNLIIGENQRGSITSKVDGEQTSFAIVEGTSTYKLVGNNKDELSFQVDIDVTARIAEYFGSEDFYNEEVLRKFENALEEEIKRLAETTIKKVKDDLQVDVLEFDDYLRIHHYDLWKEMENDWDYGENYFANSDIKINVNTIVHDPGNSIRMK